jgi:hypothetical protein
MGAISMEFRRLCATAHRRLRFEERIISRIPTLAKLSPLPAAKVVGNLSDTSGVLRALGMTE